ncbi:dihydrodipicolinate synthase family protein [Halobacillus salinarum]|uniref:Dihydrodipicolinate synthase family protein n=1 Tax=Halobacillus salinarum TaxID=2932257 RepID=A0ABY4EP91_9BACI|nr:dihydrodipicolinate synthase family protein [Halobacillus salinarum]UOQ43901.1 dihydrodipicolinate synthase family protein [Halobacillus salinarum]
MSFAKLDLPLKELLLEGLVIPAHPLALNKDRTLNEPYQRALTNYYLASGAGGIAVGVHTTQFEIRDPQINLYEKVLRLAAEEVNKASLNQPIIKVAGLAGPLSQAEKEAEIALEEGYQLGLLSMGGLKHLSEKEHLERVKEVASIIPVFGFYLQPAVGGRLFSYEFWREFAEIPGVEAIKLAPFNRYATLEVVRAVCHSTRYQEIALYTGNDDHIVADLLSDYKFKVGSEVRTKGFAGGLLGQWAVWTTKAVELLDQVKKAKKEGLIPQELLILGNELTDANRAIFDAGNDFKGSIAGINEVLKRQGLLKENICLSDHETLSPGQWEELSRVHRVYPHLHDDEFVKENVQQWLGSLSMNSKEGRACKP